ncbi:hypothetical protein EUTSA_v10027653mg [Eutrema salsugineum]|uniref:Jacalin-type lectin domain-containing protein n=1 Tax=Eutrema salsugineum TaxID=72664 RepID=V4L9P0_EUTSA|nr:myrosinase-binding protein 2 [Eutrema salsugineum]ESQ47120.1 hypothetical protein EUTSA_v10027653mg [Eutrema salsugineum]
MSEKMGPVGGNNGDAFNDGVCDGVKKITVAKEGGVFDCISYIKIEYEKDGKFETREHGTIRGELQEFSVDYPNEYITSVRGSYGHVKYYETVLIKSLIFKTTYGTTFSVLGETNYSGKQAVTEFMLEGKNGGKLLGFHGRSGQALDAIGTYFFAEDSSLKHFNLQGGNGGSAWDDGAYDGVRKILVGRRNNFVSYVRFEYAKGEGMVPHAHGQRHEVPQEFVVNYPYEHITSVEGTFDRYITSLKFKTSEGRTSPVFGAVAGTKFVFEEKGFKLVGFCGRSSDAIDALGANFGPIQAPPAPPAPLIIKMGPIGGKNGDAFDDGVFVGVKNIIVAKEGGVFDCISYIKIEYEKDGKFETREHGTIRGELQEFSVDYPNEYITSVGGSYDRVIYYETVLIKSLIFKTSYGRTSPVLGGKPAGTEFMLESKNGGRLLGFHGRSGQALDAIGTYFFAEDSSLKHFDRQGGNGGNSWDDGAYDGVRKILVGRGSTFVSYVRFEYAKGEGMVPHDHGKRQEAPHEFVVNYPHEHVTSVEGTFNRYITSLRFKTSEGRTSPVFGEVVGTKFVFEEKGFKLVGFCGRCGDAIDAIGANFGPLPPPSFIKIGPIGGNKGNIFDDGVFDGVKKVTVGKDVYSITYIKIEYEKDGNVEIREHGTNRGELEEFSVDYPKDYITVVGGTYNHIFNYDTTLITSLYFTTSRGFTSPLFGEMSGKDFNLKDENGGKLLGFLGRGGYAIDAIGAYFEIGSGNGGA